MSVTTIIRVPKVNNFTIISNGYVNDDRISWKAKGILTCLLSKPDDWQVHAEHLKTVSKDGIKAVYSGLRELIEYGYMERHAYRDDKQRITRWEYIVIEDPENNTKKVYQTPVNSENSLPAQNRQVEKIKVKNGGLLKTDKNQKQKTTTDSPHLPQPSLSSPDEKNPIGDKKISDKTTTADKAEPQPLSSSPDDHVKKNPIGDKKISDKKTTADQDIESQPLSPSPEKYRTEHETLVNLIPEPMRQPVIISLVDKYHKSHGFEHVADCIVYTNRRPQKEGNGTLQAYRGYLSKGLAGQYEGIRGFYASSYDKKDDMNARRQEIFGSISSRNPSRKKNFLIMKDGKKYEIDEDGFVSRFEYIDKNTGKTNKGALIPSQIIDIVMAGKATLE